MDAFLLVVFGWIINIKGSLMRIFGAAGAGALSACLILYFDISENNILVNILTASVMLFIYLFRRVMLSPITVIRYIAIWYFIAFAAGGLFDYITVGVISFLTIVRFVTAAGLVSYVVIGRNQLKKARLHNEDIYKLTIYKGDRSIDGYGLYDSGNSLIEPISGNIVIVGEFNYLLNFLSSGEKKFISVFPELPEVWDGETCIRSIPYSCIDNEKGHLPGIPLDAVIIKDRGRSRIFNKCYMAVLNSQLSQDRSYNFLLQHSMIFND